MKPSAPKYGFGAASRGTAQKVFVSQEHTALATAGMHSPGPAVYLLPPSVGGTQPDGRRANPPSWGFGTANRFRPMSAPAVPGPGHYPMPPGAAGAQTNSRYSTQPIFGFGSAERKHVRKVRAAQREAVAPRDSPLSSQRDAAACTSIASSNAAPLTVCPLYALSVIAVCAGKSLALSTRSLRLQVFISHNHQKVDMYGLDTPGPAYKVDLPSSIGGTQPESKTETKPSWKFSSAARAPVEAGKASPGPAAYSLPDSVGPQPDSKKPRAGTPGFGSGSRDKRSLVYLGPSHDKGMYGRGSPGPAASYQLNGSVGKQVYSKTASSPMAAFSQSNRWASYERELKKNTTPGPGAY